MLSSLLFIIFFAVVLAVILQNFSKGTVILVELVYMKEPPTSTRPEPSIDSVVGRALWGVLNTNDACMVSRSPWGLAKMMKVILQVCRAFGLTVSAMRTDTMYMRASTAYTLDDDASRSGRANLQTGAFIPLPGGCHD